MVTKRWQLSQLSMRLVALRQRSCLSRQQVAHRAGISVDLVQSLEQGRTANPRALTVLDLARALGVPYQEVMDCIAADQEVKRNRLTITERDKESMLSAQE